MRGLSWQDSRGEYERAAALLRQALRQQPSLDILHGQMGNVLYHQGKYPEALAKSFEKALVLDPAHPIITTTSEMFYGLCAGWTRPSEAIGTASP